MDISESYTLQAPREQVWDALLNPDTLKRSLPGCESVERTGDNIYTVHLRVSVAGIKGVYHGMVRLLDVRMPESYRLVVDGSGNRGILHGDGVVRLEEKDANTTAIHCAGQAQPGGALASMGMQVTRGAANILIKQYFDHMARLLPTVPATAPASEAVMAPATPATPTSTPSPAVASQQPSGVSESPLASLPENIPAVGLPPVLMGSPEAPEAVAMPAAAVAASPATAVKPDVSHARLSVMANGSAQSRRGSARMLGIVIAIVAVVIVAALVWFVVGSMR